MRSIDAAIIGTGTAALAAASELRKVTENFIIVSNGIYGTTCVRAGCMPSKVFIQGAQYYHQQKHMKDFGISGDIHMDKRQLLSHVQDLREHFLQHTLEQTQHYRKYMIEGEVFFHSPTSIEINGIYYEARRIVLATGSSPIIPPSCNHPAALTSDTLFEQENLPDAITVAGMSVLGTEMAQAFARLGMRVTVLHDSQFIGGLTDPQVNDYALSALRQEMDIILHENTAQMLDDTRLCNANCLFVAMSRKANLENMGLEGHGIITQESPVAVYDPETMQLKDFPIFVAGDVKLGRSILNEALDEGKIAGYNAARENITRFKRRTPLQIVYTEPTIAVIGKAWSECNQDSTAIGEAHYDNQGRAKIMGTACGIIRLYADRNTGKLIGSELFAPMGEHLAHALAWLIDREITVEDALQLPFYHPSLEEGIKTALEHLNRKISYRQHLL